MEQSEEDLLLQLTRQTRPYGLHRSLVKCPSFDNLIHELFNEANQPGLMDIQQGFANDSKRGEEALKSWRPPLPRLPSPKLMEVDSPSSLSQPVSGGIINDAQTLESPGTLQVTQEPRHPIPEQSAVPVPALPVFKSCPPRQLPLLETVDAETIEEILSPLSAASGTEVTQAAQTPQMEMQAKPLLMQAPQLGTTPREAKAKISVRSIGSVSSTDRDELNEKVSFIQKAVGKYHKKGGAVCSNGKIQVHEVVLVILHAGRKLNFNKILSFCTEDGTETDEVSENFTSRDTKSMGQIWQSLKGNRNANYDTFARAMRVGRERHKDYFVYLSGGKASKKRIYKLGPKALKEFDRMRGIFADQ